MCEFSAHEPQAQVLKALERRFQAKPYAWLFRSGDDRLALSSVGYQNHSTRNGDAVETIGGFPV